MLRVTRTSQSVAEAARMVSTPPRSVPPEDRETVSVSDGRRDQRLGFHGLFDLGRLDESGATERPVLLT
jgi:hypothetical protein